MTSLLFFFSLFFSITPAISMEREFYLQTLPDEAAIFVVASCENKNVLRQTCKRFAEFASRRKNENILKQSKLYLTQEALDRYLLYYGALGNIAIVRNLLARGANPNATEDNGETLMHHAVRCGYSDIAKILSEHSGFIENDTINSNPFSLLHFNQSFIDRMCPLCVFKAEKLIFNAIEKGSYSAVEYFLSLNVSANATNKEGENVLYCAARAGYLNIMKLLINKGANLNGIPGYDKQRHYQYFMPLQVASQKGHTSAVQLLIDHNADVKWYGWDFQEYVCRRGYVQIVKIILAQKPDMSKHPGLLHVAVQAGYIQMVKVLLENGADVNAGKFFDGTGDKPLDLVLNNKDIEELLIAHGAIERDGCRCVVQ